MKINIITTIAIISIVTLALLIISGVSRESLIEFENYRLVKDIDQIVTEGNSIKQQIKDIPTRETFLKERLSFWGKNKLEWQNLLSGMKNRRQLDLQKRNNQKEVLARIQSKSEPEKKYRDPLPQMTSRRKYFLTHGMYPEQYAERQRQRSIALSQLRETARINAAANRQLEYFQNLRMGGSLMGETYNMDENGNIIKTMPRRGPAVLMEDWDPRWLEGR